MDVTFVFSQRCVVEGAAARRAATVLSRGRLPAGQGGSAVLHLEGSGFSFGSARGMDLKDSRYWVDLEHKHQMDFIFKSYVIKCA